LLAAVLLPLHQSAYQLDLRSFGPLIAMLGTELFIGAVLGLSVRLIMSSLQVAGAVIAQQMGLGFVTAVDPTLGQQGVIVGNFLAMLGVTLIFATDLHHLVIPARFRSWATSRRSPPAPPPAPSASASSSRRRSSCSGSCSISGSASCRG
jgi:flagellar biosynthetic protein FliR